MAILALASITLVIGSTTSAFGLFVMPVSRDLGLDRTTINGGMVWLHIGMAAMAPLVGRLLDRSSPRLMMALGGVALGSGYLILGMVDALWIKAAVLAIGMPFAILTAGPLAGYVLLARWFRVRRGRAMAIAALGVALSSVVVSPTLAILIENLGWRRSLTTWGVVAAFLILLISRFVRDRPAADELEPGEPLAEADTAHAAPLGYKDILAKPVFYVLAAVIGTSLAVVQALLASLVPLATERGNGLLQASSLMSVLGLASIGGMLLLAVIADRFSRAKLLALCLLVVLAFTLLLKIEGTFTLLIGATFVGGLAMGTIFPIYSALIADRFGANSLGTAEGLITPIIAGMSAIALHYAGTSFDVTGSYDTTLTSFAFAIAIALLLLSPSWWSRPEREPVGKIA